MSDIVSVEAIAGKIYLIRGTKVMLDRDLATLYGVETKRLKEQVRRNIERFPEDFMFELTKEELKNWRSQFATSNQYIMGLRIPPFAFTEHGVLMLSSVLKSERAVQVNIQIMRVFTKLRQLVLDNEELRKELGELKQITDERFQIVFETLDQLINIENRPKKKIGFTVKEKQKAYGKSLPKKALDEFSLTPQAFRIWINIPGDIQIKILNDVWCRTCSDTTGIGSVNGKIEKGMLILKGICTRCGNPVTRAIENE
jgi:ORF6N domain-containing protein